MAQCPDRMADGRLFTNWRPRSSTQYYNMIANNMPDAYSYRQYMIQNANELIKRNAADAYMRTSCGPCDVPYDRGNMLPEMDQQVCDARKCTFRLTDPFGLGRSRLYDEEMNDQARASFIAAKEREQEWFRKNTAPIGGEQSQYGRYAIPGGGDIIKS